MHGLHRSPYLGMSVEFASHREYTPGDDLRHLNWKLYARHDRLYIKEYDADTNLNLYLLVDCSASMGCANAGRSKLHYAASLAAALAHLALKQHDAVGLTLYADEVPAHLPPAPSRTSSKPCSRRSPGRSSARPRAPTGRCTRRPSWQPARAGGHLQRPVRRPARPRSADSSTCAMATTRCSIFQVLDPYERDLSVDGNIRFRDLETGETLTTQAEGVREAYWRPSTSGGRHSRPNAASGRSTGSS